MTHDQTTPAPVEGTLKPCPFCGGEAELRSWDWPYERYQCRCNVCHCQARSRAASIEDAIAAWNQRHTTPEPALRWEGERLMLGSCLVGTVRFRDNCWQWVCLMLGAANFNSSTETEARTAAEQAVRDWLARAGLYTHPAPTADVVHWKFLDQMIEERIIETDQPDRVMWHGVWYDGPLATAYLETLRAIQKLARAALAKHGGA